MDKIDFTGRVAVVTGPAAASVGSTASHSPRAAPQSSSTIWGGAHRRGGSTEYADRSRG